MCDVQTRAKELLLQRLPDERKQVLNNFGIFQLVRRVETVFPHRCCDRFLMQRYAHTQKCGGIPETHRRQLGGQSNHAEVVETLTRLAKRLVVFGFAAQFRSKLLSRTTSCSSEQLALWINAALCPSRMTWLLVPS